jgi:hypothetical protein
MKLRGKLKNYVQYALPKFALPKPSGRMPWPLLSGSLNAKLMYRFPLHHVKLKTLPPRVFCLRLAKHPMITSSILATMAFCQEFLQLRLIMPKRCVSMQTACVVYCVLLIAVSD